MTTANVNTTHGKTPPPETPGRFRLPAPPLVSPTLGMDVQPDTLSALHT